MPPKQHEPIRTCVFCGLKARKRDFVRVVARINGTAEVDTDGKLEGRGAYVCLKNIKDIVDSQISEPGRLSYALRIPITGENWCALANKFASITKN